MVPALKFALIRDLLQSLEPAVATIQTSEPTEQTNTLEQALGLLVTDKPAPDDAEIKQIVVDARMEKYG